MPTTRGTWKSGTRRRTTAKYSKYTNRTSWPTTSYSPMRYNTQKKQVQAKIWSYRTINQQFSGPGKVTAFSPSGANKWINYVRNGAWVYKFNNAQFCRYFGTKWSGYTPTTAYRYLRKKFGSGIKAVTRGKGNSWLVAATPNVTARPFCNYTWK
jgi:hypothetical protein